MDIKILHIDSNNPVLMQQLQELGFENHEDFTSSKETIESKIQEYHGIVIRSRFKLLKRDKIIPKVCSATAFLLPSGAAINLIFFDKA